jgi:hypothetical protein
MPLQVDDVTALQDYLLGVVERSSHHAAKVDEVIHPLLGAIIRFKDTDRVLEVRTLAGEAKNVIWVWIKDVRYALSYDHRTECIDLRERSTSGETVASFTNKSSTAEIIRVFEQLRREN